MPVLGTFSSKLGKGCFYGGLSDPIRRRSAQKKLSFCPVRIGNLLLKMDVRTFLLGTILIGKTFPAQMDSGDVSSPWTRYAQFSNMSVQKEGAKDTERPATRGPHGYDI